MDDKELPAFLPRNSFGSSVVSICTELSLDVLLDAT